MPLFFFYITHVYVFSRHDITAAHYWCTILYKAYRLTKLRFIPGFRLSLGLSVYQAASIGALLSAKKDFRVEQRVVVESVGIDEEVSFPV